MHAMGGGLLNAREAYKKVYAPGFEIYLVEVVQATRERPGM